MKSQYNNNMNTLISMVYFNSMVRITVAMIFINDILIPYLRGPNRPIININHVIIVNDNMAGNDEYIELEEAESLSPPSDWEH
mmetsp:Transcript_137/g.115  ORF Transcript_137/g.115 Transcript_137/m.115 type:complete len:83 (-) Transcript_137:307-555(-)